MNTTNDLENFVQIAITEMSTLLTSLPTGEIIKAAEEIVSLQKEGGRVHITGIGKPGHVANYIASLLSSTGTPAYFLHGTEVTHGSSGQLLAGDIVICISNSGETEEIKYAVKIIKNNNCKVISVTGNKTSWLAKNSDINLVAHVDHEGGPLNRAPRLSVIAEILILQALSVVLQSVKQLSPADYIKWHPGGVLGKLRKDEQ
ncbi:MAG TPA: SIS domain-containing protein [Brevefilum sp.]|nr:SIS domain-containing protein [Brevefilum sp.]HOR18815.1 SIS domain-containing protein [Brevefilum sp.]HPL68715.1 SIS domain-containing protein [Brevefilum sp.]